MPVKTQIIDKYLNYGHCLSISNTEMELYVTMDVGPRIIYCGLLEDENLFFTDTERKRVTRGPKMDAFFGAGAEFYFYGGHRLWLSPQHEVRTCAPDNDPISYTLTQNGAVLKPTPQAVLGLQYTMEIDMDPKAPRVSVNCTVENIGSNTSRFAIWQLTQFAPGGYSIIPQSKLKSGCIPDRIISVWPITNLGDARFHMTDDYMTLAQDPENTRPFKIGTANHEGWAMYINAACNRIFTKSYEHVEGASYPDHGVSYETYVDGLFMELETLGTLEDVLPGEKVSHKETWEISKVHSPAPSPRGTDEEIRAFIDSVRGE